MLIVQKYGGTSVANPDRIKKVARHVADTFRNGHKVVVVVSAMAGETDRLLKLGHETGEAAAERELDALLATGEQASAALVAIAINNAGVPAVSLNAMQIPIVTDSCHQRARMKYIITDKINKLLSSGHIVIITGFQGVDDSGDFTTIGRGGSDTSAVAIAKVLNADWCEIYSDVGGLYSADPNACPKAVKIERASYEELLETAGAGAKVVHMHAVELAARHNVFLHLKKSPSLGADTAGTKITQDINMEDVMVSTVAQTLNEAKLSVEKVPNKVGIAARIFEPLARANINVDMIVQNVAKDGTSAISFTIAKQDLKKAMQLTEAAAREMGAGKVEVSGDVAKISIIGVGMRSHAGVAARMFETLARHGIDIQMISTSEIKVSVVIDSKHASKAVSVLHEAFISSA
ncbi:MAG: aspartate kinase [Deltaproteobacteria bacterium RIFCSPLOWO2_02_FULL_47_10]|nr:MAG: aspartate kinase [Deltaproteobacteria bacterium RIFCSPLOWO2_02_FULL_47_10]